MFNHILVWPIIVCELKLNSSLMFSHISDWLWLMLRSTLRNSKGKFSWVVVGGVGWWYEVIPRESSIKSDLHNSCEL